VNSGFSLMKPINIPGPSSDFRRAPAVTVDNSQLSIKNKLEIGKYRHCATEQMTIYEPYIELGKRTY